MKWHFALIAFCLATAVGTAPQQSPTKDRKAAQQTQVHGCWTDAATGLVWAGKDNGRSVSWKAAVKYCRNLRLAGYSDWRLANMFELPGLAGADEQFAWHVKGSLFLTGDEWSSSYRKDDRGRFSGYVYYFDFNEGRSNDDPTGWPYFYSGMRALCVLGSAIRWQGHVNADGFTRSNEPPG